jgi:hypothetical protein
MAVKRKRAPGGGRKQGEFGGGPPFSIRLPDAMRDQLEAAAGRNNRTLAQEILARLNSSLGKTREKSADPTMRALCFMFSTLAGFVHMNGSWRSDPFLFRAIKIGIGKLLDALEPQGEIKLPDFWRAFVDIPVADWMKPARESQIAATQSPEAMGAYAAWLTLENFRSPRPQNWDILKKAASLSGREGKIFNRLLNELQDTYYGMEDAKRDLKVKGEK